MLTIPQNISSSVASLRQRSSAARKLFEFLTITVSTIKSELDSSYLSRHRGNFPQVGQRIITFLRDNNLQAMTVRKLASEISYLQPKLIYPPQCRLKSTTNPNTRGFGESSMFSLQAIVENVINDENQNAGLTINIVKD